MPKNKQKQEKAARNLENAMKYRKKPTSARRGGPRRGPRPASADDATVGTDLPEAAKPAAPQV